MPTLNAIAYRHFEVEEQAIEAALRGETHDFGGELVLTFQEDPRIFVSWVNEPVQHAIGFKGESHFLPDTLTEVDVSAAPIWAVLIGQEVSLAFIGADNQVLKVSSADDHVLVCSFEQGGWWADELTVCKEMPAPYGA